MNYGGSGGYGNRANRANRGYGKPLTYVNEPIVSGSGSGTRRYGNKGLIYEVGNNGYGVGGGTGGEYGSDYSEVRPTSLSFTPPPSSPRPLLLIIFFLVDGGQQTRKW